MLRQTDDVHFAEVGEQKFNVFTVEAGSRTGDHGDFLLSGLMKLSGGHLQERHQLNQPVEVISALTVDGEDRRTLDTALGVGSPHPFA